MKNDLVQGSVCVWDDRGRYAISSTTQFYKITSFLFLALILQEEINYLEEMRNEITVCKKRDFAFQDCKLSISIAQTHCRVSDVTKPLTLSMKRRCVTDRKLFGSYVFSRDWG